MLNILFSFRLRYPMMPSTTHRRYDCIQPKLVECSQYYYYWILRGSLGSTHSMLLLLCSFLMFRLSSFISWKRSQENHCCLQMDSLICGFFAGLFSTIMFVHACLASFVPFKQQKILMLPAWDSLAWLSILRSHFQTFSRAWQEIAAHHQFLSKLARVKHNKVLE